MGSESFKEVSLADIASFRNGKAIAPEKYTPDGKHPVFGSNGQIAWSDEVLCPDPAIVIGRVGAYCGSVHYVSTASWITDNAIVATPQEGNDIRYLYYLLGSLGLERTAIGSAQPLMTQKGIKVVQTKVPPLSEQKAIAHVLGTLDDKIELNRRMNATLEGMAQALFKSWFVDFDPVIDNALAAGNPIPDELAPRAEVRRQTLVDGTANREAAKPFPAAFQQTDSMGWIPEGWEIQALYDIANFVNGAAYKGDDFSDSPDALPVIKIAEVKAGITAQTKFTEINKGDKYRVEDGDILLSWSGNPDTSIDTFIWTDGQGYLNQHIFNVRLCKETERHFVYYQLKYLRSTFAEIARDKQTTGLGHFTAGDMKRLMIFRPTEALLEDFNAAISSVYSRGYGNSLATKTLTKLRDTLLPKLISGEIRTSTTW